VDNTCVVIRPVAAWAAVHVDPARIRPFAHRWADSKTSDLEVLARRRECLTALAAAVGSVGHGDATAKLRTQVEAVKASAHLWAREWSSDWRIGHHHWIFAHNVAVVLLPALASIERTQALSLVFRFLDDACPRVALGAVPSCAA
jgi:hypothetical protein